MSSLRKEIEQVDAILHYARHPVLRQHLTTLGCDSAHVQEGQFLLNRLRCLHRAQQVSYQSKQQANQRQHACEQEVHRHFVKHRALAKEICRHDPAECQRLRLHLPLATRKAARLAQMISFYHEALNAPQVFSQYGLSPAALQQAQALTASLHSARCARRQKAKEARDATQKRDEVRHDLHAWATSFRAAARAALRPDQSPPATNDPINDCVAMVERILFQ